MLIVNVRGYAHDAPRLRADSHELHHRIRPVHVPVHRVLIREHPLCQRLAHDDHRLLAFRIQHVEIASGDQRNAQRHEESRRHSSELGTRIFFPRGAYVAVARKLEAGTEIAGIPPWNHDPESRLIHPGQRLNAPDRVFVEVHYLLRRLAVGHRWNIDGQHPPRIHSGPRCLHRNQRLEQHARAGQQHERRRDLRDRENAQPPVCAAGNANAPRAQAGPLR